MQFSHLHVHTQYSLLDGAASIKSIMQNAKANGMTSIAITDHGNMFGVPEFVAEAKKNNILPIVGCEFYLARGSRFERSKSEDVEEKNIFHQLLLAKNQTGYKNLSRLSSLAFTEGFYYKPRIDKELLRKYSEGLIATTCCLASEVNQCILRKGEAEAEVLFKEWLDIFGEDYYIELQRHGLKEQDQCNEVLVKWARKYNVKMIATNDVHYVNMKDSEAQDILLCLQTRKDYDDPNRMRFENNQFYLKSQEQMIEVFKDIPEAIDNTGDVVSKIEMPNLKRDILLPIFEMPPGFTNADEYLRHLSFEGALLRYGDINEEVRTRLDFELGVIQKMGFAGYFLIVQDFIAAARKINVSVGPGRGSAAGSIVAYCIWITNIDPVHYNLLFERFLNPDRVTMPDIDIDFEDSGRAKVIDYVINKYGKNRVAQIVTFGTMAARSSIRDVARVLKLPLAEADRLAKLIPNKPGTTLKDAFKEVKELNDAKENGSALIMKTLGFAEVLEGCARHTGVHAAGIIIAPDDLIEYVPLCTSKESDLLVTQYEGSFVEGVGMLKMDFLGLKTLTILKDAIELLQKNRGITIDLDKIPLDDPKTFQLYQRGETVGTFQFESDGMRAHLKDLKPTNIEELIAMNALYRPGPMDSIPSFINRKMGKEPISYPHPIVEDLLKPTYGIIVYQEQVMLIVQQLAGFTKGQADALRKAMGKKDMVLLEKQRPMFVEGAGKNGMSEVEATELFEKMRKFGEYAFNRSHSAAYSVLSYQTGYLKANFPAEFMAAVLTNNLGDMSTLAKFMDECRVMGYPVLGPDVNESFFKFSVNPKGQIRFGLGAVKGVGEGAATAIVEERLSNGDFKSIFNLAQRVNLRSANRKCFEALAAAGAFDGFKGIHRRQYFFTDISNAVSCIEQAIKYGSTVQDNLTSVQPSLFGESNDAAMDVVEPRIPECEPWTKMETLRQEKEYTGIYITGHPLDAYKFEIEHFCNVQLSELDDLKAFKNKELIFAGIVTSVDHKVSKKGNPFGQFSMEDYAGSLQFTLFSEDYVRFKPMLEKSNFLFVKARVQGRFNSEDSLEVKVNQLIRLADVSGQLAKNINIKVALQNIDETWIDRLHALCLANPGRCGLNIIVIDNELRYSAELPSKSIRVAFSHDLLTGINDLKPLSVVVS